MDGSLSFKNPTSKLVLVLLTAGMIAGLFACGIAYYFVSTFPEEMRHKFAEELPYGTKFCFVAKGAAFAFPLLLWLMALRITSRGRENRQSGLAIAVMLFMFAGAWPLFAWASVEGPQGRAGATVRQVHGSPKLCVRQPSQLAQLEE